MSCTAVYVFLLYTPPPQNKGAYEGTPPPKSILRPLYLKPSLSMPVYILQIFPKYTFNVGIYCCDTRSESVPKLWVSLKWWCKTKAKKSRKKGRRKIEQSVVVIMCVSSVSRKFCVDDWLSHGLKVLISSQNETLLRGGSQTYWKIKIKE